MFTVPYSTHPPCVPDQARVTKAMKELLDGALLIAMEHPHAKA